MASECKIGRIIWMGTQMGWGQRLLQGGNAQKELPLGTPVREGSVSGARKGKTLKKTMEGGGVAIISIHQMIT